MRLFHFLQKAMTQIMVFMFSPAGGMLALLVVFSFDLWTNHLGIEVMFEKRLSNQGHASASNGSAFWFATGFSLLGSAMLGMGVMNATFHNRKGSMYFIGTASALISLMGMEYGFYKGNPISFVTMTDWIEFVSMQVMFLALAISPQKVYADNASLIIEKFGPAIKEYLTKTQEQMSISLKGQIGILSEIDKKRLQALAEEEGIDLDAINGGESNPGQPQPTSATPELSNMTQKELEDFLNL